MKENMEKNIEAGKRSIVAKFGYTIFLYLPVPSKKSHIVLYLLLVQCQPTSLNIEGRHTFISLLNLC